MERRLLPRFSVQNRAFVEVSGDESGLPYHMIDISEGGMAFRYLNLNPLNLTGSQMDIYLDKDLYVGRLPVTVVADQKWMLDDSLSKRHCSVSFGNLTPVQQKQLQAFIHCQATSVQDKIEPQSDLQTAQIL